MPLVFPIATDARTALDAADLARTAIDAKARTWTEMVLVSEWLRPPPAEYERLKARLDVGVANGFVQIYEDVKGRPVLAVTFWKARQLPVAGNPGAGGSGPRARASKGKARASQNLRGAAENAPDTAPDKVDEAGARRKSAGGKELPRKSRGRPRGADQRQLDLFGGPDQAGAETPDPHNPDVVLVEEEGDGATFGLAGTAPVAAPRARQGRRKT